MANPEDIQQEQLNASRQQLAKQSAQAEVLGGVILELAASQAQQGEIEQRQISREKKIRRRTFIFNQIEAQWNRMTAKKSFIHATNLYEKDRVEQVAQADAGIATAKNTNKVFSSLEFIALDIRKLVNFMMGNKLQEEENRRELFALLAKRNESSNKQSFVDIKSGPGFLRYAAFGFAREILAGITGFLGIIIGVTSGIVMGFIPGLAKGFAKGIYKSMIKPMLGVFRKIFSATFGKIFSSIFGKLNAGESKRIVAVRRMFKRNLFKLRKFMSSLSQAFTMFKTNVKQLRWFRKLKANIHLFRKMFRSNGIIQRISKMLSRFTKSFRLFGSKLGTIFGKLFGRVFGVFFIVTGFIEKFKTSKYENMFLRLLDSAFAGLGNAAGFLVGGMIDLVKGVLSWVVKKLGFEGLSEWLDSFSFEEKIKTGMSGLLEMLDDIFTKLVPALTAGVLAAINPYSDKTFGEAFSESYTSSDSNNSGYGQLTPEQIDQFKDLNEQIQDLRLARFENEQKIKEGDKGGSDGLFRRKFDRKDELQKQDLIMTALQKERNRLAQQMQAVKKPSITIAANIDALVEDTAESRSAGTNKARGSSATVITDASSQSSTVVNNNSIGQHVDRTLNLATAQ